MQNVWAIVLAGGDGTRLQSLTQDRAGNPVPKQFCSMNGVESLTMQTVARAQRLVDRERITAIVSAPHEPHWQPSLRGVLPRNTFVQPFNRGTAVGILLPALRIFANDPDARILILPADHFVADEAVLESALRRALHSVRFSRRGVALLGIETEEADPELGYIVAARAEQSALLDVRRFVEKPAMDEARRLCSDGALWNSFIIACRARSLIELFRTCCPAIVESCERLGRWDYATLADVYDRIAAVDFSRQIAAMQVERFAVMPVPWCGWNDLGTPRRLAQTLACHPTLLSRARAGSLQSADGHINLAERLLQAHPHDLAIARAQFTRRNMHEPVSEGDLVRSRLPHERRARA